MDLRAIHSRARQALDSARSDPRRIALSYTAACCLLALLMTVISDVLSSRISDTGGLGNLGLRSVLSTGQYILPFLQVIVSSCLGLGYHICALRISREQEAHPATLLEGFRNFGPLLRAMLFEGAMYFALGFTTLYLSSFIFAATPFAEPFYELMNPYLAQSSVLSGQTMPDEATMMAVMETMVPMMWIWLVIFLLLFIPMYYGYRMTLFCIADNPRMGALAALRRSKQMMRRNRFTLFRLDLSMWWFYLLQVLISVICYADILLPKVGIDLGWNSKFSYYFFFILSLAVQAAAYCFLLNRVNVAYAVAYDTLQSPKEPEPAKKPNFPFPTEY